MGHYRLAGRMMNKYTTILSIAAILFLASMPAHAKSAGKAERDAFALGYCMEYSRLKALEFTTSVRELSRVTDDGLGGAMVASLVKRGEELRRLESDALGRSAQLLHSLNGSQRVEDWMRQNAAALAQPFKITPKRTDTEDQVNTAHLTAIIDDTGRVQKELQAQLSTIDVSVQVSDGPAPVWSEAVGSYVARIDVWTADEANIKSLQQNAQVLVAGEPPNAPQDADQVLRSIQPDTPQLPALQPGAGNLAALLPTRAEHTTSDALHKAPGALLDIFDANDVVKALAAPH